MVATETAGGIGIIGMVGEMVVVVGGIGVVIGLAAEGVDLVVEGSTAAEGEGIGIGRLGFQGRLFFSFLFLSFFGRLGVFASTTIEGGGKGVVGNWFAAHWDWYFGQDLLRENEPLWNL